MAGDGILPRRPNTSANTAGIGIWQDRLKHIFEKQVYGLAPTEIIYRIATNYILGFEKDVKITKHNFRQADALPYAKEGKLDRLIDRLFEDDGKE